MLECREGRTPSAAWGSVGLDRWLFTHTPKNDRLVAEQNKSIFAALVELKWFVLDLLSQSAEFQVGAQRDRATCN
jgi:hypothetical protein